MITPEQVEEIIDSISYATFRSHFDNKLLDIDSELNMTAYMSEFFDLDQGPEMYMLIDQTIDRIKSLEEALKK